MKINYHPFGMAMPERNETYGNSALDYRYAYNGMEVDNEVAGEGNSYTTEFRQYDPRLGRWKSLDPLMAKFPSMSPYVAFDNNPIYYIDPYGLNSVNDTGPPEDAEEGDVWESEGGNKYTFTDGGWLSNKYQNIDEVVARPDVCGQEYADKLDNIEMNTTDHFDFGITGIANGKSMTINAIRQAQQDYLDCQNYMYPTPPQPMVEPSSTAVETLHTVLDLLGMAPVIGEIFDVVNALIYAAEGDFVNAGVSATAVIPLVGSFGTGARLAKKAASEVIQETEQVVVKEVTQHADDVWKGPANYDDLIDHRSVGGGKRYTQSQKRKIRKRNMEHNGGVLRSDLDGTIMSKPKRSRRGRRTDMNQAEVDHIRPRSKGGSNSYKNAQLLTKKQNLRKSNN